MKKNTCMIRRVMFFAIVGLLSFSNPGYPKEVKEHPMIRPFPGSVLAKNMSKYHKFDAHTFYVKNEKTGKREKRTVKGEYYQLLYEVRTKSGDRVKGLSTVEFFENYKTAAIQKGGKTVFEDRGQIVLTIPREDGGTTWCRVTTNAGMAQQYLTIVDEAPFKQSMVFGPQEMKEALDKDGRIRLYGILFDLDKADLKQDSDKQLQHVVTLLRTYPALKVEIQGHTDNQGKPDYNQDLSRERSETVLQYMQLFGISPNRMAAKGYGETRPVAPNNTEEGRAKNRRVELVKMGDA